jgi:acyl dehydratase
MALPTKHVLSQGPVIASLGGTALAAILQRVRKQAPSGPPATPGPELTQTLPPRSPELVRDYVKHVGGDPSAYRGTIPAHFFPQWGFPLAAKTLRGISYPLEKVLNGGCRLEINSPLPLGDPLHVAARLESVDDDGRRAILHQRISTNHDAVVGHMYAIVPLSRADKTEKKKSEPARVPQSATEIGYWRLGPDAGLAFAMLTGDFNPVHWIPAYARTFGFKSTILHGFATMARAIEGLARGLWAGDATRLTVFDCKFTRPLLLPARVGLYVEGNTCFVGDAPGGPAYLVGNFQTRSSS